jgi:iron complex outermembrane recepter protein
MRCLKSPRKVSWFVARANQRSTAYCGMGKGKQMGRKFMTYQSRRSVRAQLLASVAIGGIAFGSASAFAQDQDSDEEEFSLEEIMVTAQKRPKTLQQTPIAVSVTSAQTIERARVLDINDLQSVVPSLRVWTLQTSTNTNFAIRGFGNGANNAGIEPSVGVFIDGVYRSRSAAQIGDLPRLERIEVLRGPQSTLFGKNASAGVISIVSAAPSYETEGGVEFSYGNYNARIAKAYFTGGLSDTFAVSVSGGFNKRDGYNKALQAGIPDLNDRNRWNIRGQALWEPSEDVRFRLIADYNNLDEVCCAVTNIINGPTAGAIQFLGGTVLDDANPFSYTSPINEIPINTVKDGGVSLQADIDYEGFALTSISAYRSNKSFNDTEADYTGLEILDSANNRADIGTYTQEIRLTSTGDNTVDWMVGGYYFKEKITQVQGLEYGDDLRAYFDTLLGSSPGILGTLEALSGNAPGSFFNGDTRTVETFTQDDEAYSLFATVDVHLNDRLTLTGGMNYTNDKKTVTGSTVNGDILSSVDLFNVNGGLIPAAFFGAGFQGATGLAPTPANIAFIESVAPGTSAAIQAGVTQSITNLQALQFQPPFLAFPNAVQDGKSADNKITWTARLAYELSDNVNVYFSAATGYKATSWNLSRDARPFIQNRAALQAAGLTQSNQSYGTLFANPEEATVYEIGLKARFSRGAINIAVFDQTIKDFQSNIFLGTGFVLGNAGKQSTKGVEIDATFVPSESFEFRFAGTFMDPIYDSFPDAPGGDLSGTKPAGIASTAMSIAATYFFDIGEVSSFIRSDWAYESNVQVVDNIPGVDRKVSTFNASMGFEWENGMNLNIWARNLFNDQYFLSAFPGVIQSGTFNGYASQPRTWGATLGYKF